MTTSLALCLFAALAEFVVEPDTGREFSSQIESDGVSLQITGADVRKVTGIAVYAIAHYGSESSPAPEAPAASLEYWIDSDTPKAIVLRGTRRIPARGIKWSWEDSLDRVGYTGDNREPFIAAFTQAFGKKSEMIMLAKPGGTLIVRQDGSLLDEWNDPELVRAVWEVSLGESSEVKTRENLVRVGHLENAG